MKTKLNTMAAKAFCPAFLLVAVLLAVSAKGGLIVIDFEGLVYPPDYPPANDGIAPAGCTYAEDGFQLAFVGGACPASPAGGQFNFIHHPATHPSFINRFSESISFFNGAQLGRTSLARRDWGSFDVLSIDLDALNPASSSPPYNSSLPGEVTFIGFRADYTTAEQTFYTDTVFPARQTFTFNSSFTNLIRLQWDQQSSATEVVPYHQFDNIVLRPRFETVVIADQSTGQTGGHLQSQDFPDVPTNSVSVFDDFTIATAWAVGQLTVFGREFGSSSNNLDVVAGIYALPDLTTTPIPRTNGTQVAGGLVFDFGGAVLPPGMYWVGAQVVRPNSAGGWHWNLRLPVSGSEARWHNPGGGLGWGTAPVPVGTVLEQADLAFVLSGIPAGTVATPTFIPAGGTSSGPQYVTVMCASPGAEIHYTTNGVDPTESDPTVSSGGNVFVDRSLTLKARAWSVGFVPGTGLGPISSSIASAVYTLEVATPTFSPPGGVYDTTSLPVTVGCVTPGVTIHYTTNGSDPTESDPVVDPGWVGITRSLTLKAKAWRAGATPSGVASAVYTLQATAPTFSPPGGIYGLPQTVALSSVTPGATIHYTTDGSTPTTNSTAIPSGGTVTINVSATLKAIAVSPDSLNSSVATATYTLTVTTPTITPGGGTYNTVKTVVISCATPGATIHYTTSGLEATESNPVIASGGTLLVDHSLTLKAKAWLAGWSPSDGNSAVYTLKVATPTITPGGGNYDAFPTVTISCATAGTTIHYTTSGLEPTESHPVIASGGTLLVDRSLTLKAKAWLAGWTPSDGNAAVYTLWVGHGGSFQGVGDLPGGYVYSIAQGVSADGLFVVGTSYGTNGHEAYRWTAGGGMVGLGAFPSPIPNSQATAVSADGAVVVGSSLMNNDHFEAFRWTEGTGMVPLGELPGGSAQSAAFGVSASGGVAVGYASSANGREAFRWVGGSMQGLGDLPEDDFYSEAYGVSADGSVVVGYSRSGSGPEAFRWTPSGGMVGLGAPDQNQFESRSFGVSADGTVIVGYAWYPDSGPAGSWQPFRWTQAGGMVKLGDVPNGVLTTQVPAVLISGNGAVVVGNGYPRDPFMWDAAHGIRNLRDVLVNWYGLNLNDWTLTSVSGISHDGLTIVGSGVRTGSGATEGWIARLASGPPVPPEMQITHSGDTVTLSWPVSADAWELQATSNLLESNSWTAITNGPIVIDRRNWVADPISGTAGFYRLKLP